MFDNLKKAVKIEQEYRRTGKLVLDRIASFPGDVVIVDMTEIDIGKGATIRYRSAAKAAVEPLLKRHLNEINEEE